MKLIPTYSQQQQERFNDWSLLFLRIAFGWLMLYGHGWRKMLKIMSGEEIDFLNFLGLGAEISLALTVFSEVICSLLLMLGLFTRAVALPLFFTMCVAFFVVHFNDPFPKMEKSIMYGVAYLVLMLSGGGRFSLDYLIWKRS